MLDWNLVWQFFIAGLLAPLGAICVLPLYPGFLAFLAKSLSDKPKRSTLIWIGFLIMFGILTLMALIGLIFVFILSKDLSSVIGVISPIAFGVLLLVGVLLVFNVNFSKLFPHYTAPTSKNPKLAAYLFGFFFGIIVLPCNPGPIIFLFSNSLTVTSGASNFLGFMLFGFGMSLPLIILSIASTGASQQFTRAMARHRKIINVLMGLIMIAFALWNLISDFNIFGFIG